MRSVTKVILDRSKLPLDGVHSVQKGWRNNGIQYIGLFIWIIVHNRLYK